MFPAFPFATSNLQEFVVTVLASGLVGVIVSWVIEQFIPGWHTAPAWLPKWVGKHWGAFKRWFVFAVAVALPFAAAWGLHDAGPAYWVQSKIYAYLAAQGLLVWLGTQFGHAIDPARLKPFLDQLITAIYNHGIGLIPAAREEDQVDPTWSGARIVHPSDKLYPKG